MSVLIAPVIVLALTGCAGPSVDRVQGVLTGSFSSASQAAADPEHYFDIRLETVPIWTWRRDGPWLYVEQATAASLEKPYRQRIYRLESLGGDTVRSHVYTMPNSLDCAGWWRTPAYFDDALTPTDLDLREGCSITLTEAASHEAWIGGTRGEGCESSLRGAVFATSEVELFDTHLLTWDRGFDAAGGQVWGATEGPYRFDRVGTGGDAGPESDTNSENEAAAAVSQ